MNAKKFLHKKDVAYMNRLSTPLDFDRIVSLMEEYAALRIHNVVGQSERLVCPDCADGRDEFEPDWKCPDCRQKDEAS